VAPFGHQVDAHHRHFIDQRQFAIDVICLNAIMQLKRNRGCE